jgi:hypothetical protein
VLVAALAVAAAMGIAASAPLAAALRPVGRAGRGVLAVRRRGGRAAVSFGAPAARLPRDRLGLLLALLAFPAALRLLPPSLLLMGLLLMGLLLADLALLARLLLAAALMLGALPLDALL